MSEFTSEQVEYFIAVDLYEEMGDFAVPQYRYVREDAPVFIRAGSEWQQVTKGHRVWDTGTRQIVEVTGLAVLYDEAAFLTQRGDHVFVHDARIVPQWALEQLAKQQAADIADLHATQQDAVEF